MLRRVSICLSLFVFATATFAQTNSDSYFAYLEKLYRQHDKKLHDYLLDEFARFR